jgi:serine/threonine protein kinase
MTAKKLIECLSSALKYLHEKGITHSNIKSSNIQLFNAVDTKSSKIKFVDFMSSLTISHEKLNQKNDSETIAIEDHMNDDLLDLYFVFKKVLSITHFLRDSDRHIAQQPIRKMITLDANSTKALNKLLTNRKWLKTSY